MNQNINTLIAESLGVSDIAGGWGVCDTYFYGAWKTTSNRYFGKVPAFDEDLNAMNFAELTLSEASPGKDEKVIPYQAIEHAIASSSAQLLHAVAALLQHLQRIEPKLLPKQKA